jgi:hypothetical protein
MLAYETLAPNRVIFAGVLRGFLKIRGGHFP